jgi:phage-related minor tail protein
MFSRRSRLKRELRELDRQLEALEAQKHDLEQTVYTGKTANLFLRRGVIIRQIASIDAEQERRQRTESYPVDKDRC